MKKKSKPVNNLVVVSDTHIGSLLGLIRPEGAPMDEGVRAIGSPEQRWMWEHWLDFWNEWVPETCHGEPFGVVLNGDALDGVPHGSKAEVTTNTSQQQVAAVEILKPIVDLCEGRYYHIRGTEAHSGKSGEAEESLAIALGAIPDVEGRHARYELWARVGFGLVHIAHAIGCTSSMAYETSAVQKELQESYAEAGRWNTEPPNVVVRSHRHRMVETRVASSKGYAIACVTAGWQLKTPFVFRLASGRTQAAQIGGMIVRCGDKDVYTRHRVWALPRPAEEIIRA
jgi:hypothetical protein